MKRRRRHWYYVTYTECAVCGRGDIVRERRYGRKPRDARKRYEFIERYDWCDAL
jgi:hypothetical protein